MLEHANSEAFPILSAIIFTPLIAAFVLLFVPDTQRSVIRGVALAGAGISALASAWVSVRFVLDPQEWMFVEFYEIIPVPGVTYTLACDGWSASLLLLTGIIIFTGTWASFSIEERLREFFVFLLVLVAGVYGVFVAQDLLLFFLFYEIAVLPMFLLIGIWGSTGKVAAAGPFAWALRMLDVGGREYAAMKLTLMLLIGSALILAAFLAMGLGAGSFMMDHIADVRLPYWTQWFAFPALWIGFGTLAGLWPFHTWSPDGHAAAPTAVSMLHAGVLMKLGAFGVMRVGMVLLPEGAEEWALVVGSVACVNIFYGAVSAMAQRDLKYVVAYSSVSHMGVVMLGAATLTVVGWNGAVYQMFAHGIMTGLFFALVGIIYDRTHDRWIPRMGGFARIMPVVAVAFVVAGLSSLGMPGTAGFVAEIMVFLGAWQTHPWWAVTGVVGAFITALYVMKAVRGIFFGDGPPERFASLGDATGSELVAPWMLGLCLIVFGAWPAFLLDMIDATTPGYLAHVAAKLAEAAEAAQAAAGGVQ